MLDRQLEYIYIDAAPAAGVHVRRYCTGSWSTCTAILHRQLKYMYSDTASEAGALAPRAESRNMTTSVRKLFVFHACC